jgi:hypothetical protein
MIHAKPKITAPQKATEPTRQKYSLSRAFACQKSSVHGWCPLEPLALCAKNSVTDVRLQNFGSLTGIEAGSPTQRFY